MAIPTYKDTAYIVMTAGGMFVKDMWNGEITMTADLKEAKHFYQPNAAFRFVAAFPERLSDDVAHLNIVPVDIVATLRIK